MLLHLAAALVPLLIPVTVSPQNPVMSEDELIENYEALEWETGQVTVQGDMATIDLPEGWTYLGPVGARFMVEDLMGNPPDPDVLGLAAPPGESEWFVIVSFEEDGYVSDDDATDIDFDELMDDIQAGEEEVNRERKRAGYETVSVLGWAEKPHYDSTQKKLYWAKRIKFGDTPGVTLNYDTRILGRRGTLVMKAVADDAQLAEVTKGCQLLLAGTAFKDGHRYDQFDSSMDNVAAYGIGGLIAGKALLKIGFFAKFGKFLVIGGAFLLGGLRKLFGGKQVTEKERRQRKRKAGRKRTVTARD